MKNRGNDGGNDGENDREVINLKTGGDTSVNVQAKGEVVIKPTIKRRVSPPPEGSISLGQKAEINKKIEEWVGASMLVGRDLGYGAARSRFLKQAKSMGKAGAPDLGSFPACDFDRGMAYLRMEIGKIHGTNKFIANDPEKARKVALAEIHKKIKDVGIEDSQYREYLLAEYGVNSAKDMSMGQLMNLRDYVRNGGRFLIPKPKEKSVFELRVDSLERLMADRNGEGFSSIGEAHNYLLKHDRGLFDSLGVDAFSVFWKKQQVTKLKRGRKASAKEMPV